MVGIRKDNYKEVDDYCKIFSKYWVIDGSCRFEEYDSEKGLFGDYMFKGFDEWNFFDTEFGNLKYLDKFVETKTDKIMETKRTGFLQFVKIIESKKNVYEKRDVKTSLISYLKSELKIIETDYDGGELELKLIPGKDGKSRKSIRCWGDVDTNGDRRLTLKCFNERVYDNEDDAKIKKSYGFTDSTKECVVNTIKDIIKDYEDMNNEDIVLWYNHKNEDKSVTPKLISDKGKK